MNQLDVKPQDIEKEKTRKEPKLVEKKTKIDDLRWVRVFTSSHIPKYLVEQIQNRDYKVEDFYLYQDLNCLQKNDESFSLNPLNQLYVLVDKENLTKGFVWFTIDTLAKDIYIHTFSMDREYWFKGRSVKKLADFMKDFRKKGNLNKIYWITNHPKHSIKNGFSRSDAILMEYSGEKDG